MSRPSTPEHQELNESGIKECLLQAEELKAEGNDNFRAQEWSAALVSYRTGLSKLPARKERDKAKGKGKAVDADENPPSDDEGEPAGESKSVPDQSKEVEVEEPVSAIEAECAKARAVLNANIGACHVKLGDHKEVVRTCTEALLDDPTYVRALQRRAASNEKINTWSSLSSAQEDYQTLLDLLPPTSPQLAEVKRSLQSIKPRAEQAQKQEMGEMMDKLKGLGNSVLGNFGLSTDNFKFEPNGQGGYSMNFAR